MDLSTDEIMANNVLSDIDNVNKNLDKKNIIERSRKELEIIKMHMITYDDSSIKILSKQNYYVNKIYVLICELSTYHYFYKNAFYFYRNNNWYKYLTKNMKHSQLNMELAILVDKSNMVKKIKKCLLKHFNNDLFFFVTNKDCHEIYRKDSDYLIDGIKNRYEDYLVISDNEEYIFYKTLLIYCEFLFEYNECEF
jgi:hypothetical protein